MSPDIASVMNPSAPCPVSIRQRPRPSDGGLLRDDQDHHARVPRAVADLGEVADLPLAADAERDFARLAPAEVRERDDGDLALRLVPDVLRDALDPRGRGRREHVGEVVDEPARWRDLGSGLEQHGRSDDCEAASKRVEHVGS